MVEAGHDFGPSTQYGWIKFTHYSFFLYDFFCLILGSTLIKCGQTHQKLGHTYKDFIQSVVMGYMQPLKSFLEGEMKSITVNILTFFWSIIKKKFFLERTSYIRNEAFGSWCSTIKTEKK